MRTSFFRDESKPFEIAFNASSRGGAVVGIDQINVHRQAGHVVNEQIDCSSPFHGKPRRFEEGRSAFQ